MVDLAGVEPATSATCPPVLVPGGDSRSRTGGLCNANAALYQLSYIPNKHRPSRRVRMQRSTN